MPAAVLSLIICTYERPQAVRKLLESLRGQTRPPDEVLVMDASVGAGTEAVVAAAQQTKTCGTLRYIRVSNEHRGLTRQRNFGVARAQGTIVAFLDDDTVPEPSYFREILDCFERHPEAGGVGGYIVGVRWRLVDPAVPARSGTFRWGAWERCEDLRWRLRKALKLVSDSPPGMLPPSGHGRSVGFLPPTGVDYAVEFIMGGASAWHRALLHQVRFSRYFEGYGLYEDLDFCIRVSRRAPLFLCTRAKLAHYHEPAARPQPFRYGRMVVRNGWYVWRLRWPSPRLEDRLRWWSITILLATCRLFDLRGKKTNEGPIEALGRFVGAMLVLGSRVPLEAGDHQAGVVSVPTESSSSPREG